MSGSSSLSRRKNKWPTEQFYNLATHGGTEKAEATHSTQHQAGLQMEILDRLVQKSSFQLEDTLHCSADQEVLCRGLNNHKPITRKAIITSPKMPPMASKDQTKGSHLGAPNMFKPQIFLVCLRSIFFLLKNHLRSMNQKAKKS